MSYILTVQPGRTHHTPPIEGTTTVTERWHARNLRLHFGTLIQTGGLLYGSTGGLGPSFLAVVDLNTCTIMWRDRAFARAQLLHADGTVIVLDEDGILGLAEVSSRGLEILAQARISSMVMWTPPTLAGTIAYIFDREQVSAFDLGL